MKTELKRNCEACRWWAPIVRQRMLGICGHRDHAGTAVDKLETCDDFEEKEDRPCET